MEREEPMELGDVMNWLEDREGRRQRLLERNRMIREEMTLVEAEEEAHEENRKIRIFPELPACYHGVHEVTLEKGGKVSLTCYTVRKEEHEPFEVIPTSPALWRAILRASVKLAEDYTLRDLFLMLDRLEGDLALEVWHRVNVYDEGSFKEWTDALRYTGPKQDPPLHRWDEIEYLEVYTGGQYFHNDLSLWFDFHGIGTPIREDELDEFEKANYYRPEAGWQIPWALCASSAHHFLDLPLRYNNKVEVWDMEAVKDAKSLLSATQGIRLHEFIHAVLYELGAYREDGND